MTTETARTGKTWSPRNWLVGWEKGAEQSGLSR